MQKYSISVGSAQCDIKGFTNTHIQCAVDRVAFLGGGEVKLSEGVFALADSLHLRSHVSITGQGAGTVLRKNAMKSARVSTYLGYGHFDLVVDTPDVFVAGEGYIIGDDNSFGFYQTVGTIVSREGGAWMTDTRHAHDYSYGAHGFVKTLFAPVSAIDVEEVSLRGVSIDGNAAENEIMNPCRGAGVFAHRARGVTVRDVTVRNYNGEGLGFQTCEDVEFDSCIADGCAGNGFHPGSGSVRFRIRRCVARNCGANGLFYCLHARHGVVEDCVFESNKEHGMSVGGRDTDNVNRGLTIRGNGGAGFFFRGGDRAIAPHRTTIEACAIQENCAAEGAAEIVLQGQAEGVVIADTVIRRRHDRPGILIRCDMPDFELRGVTIAPPEPGAIVDERRGG